MYYEQKESIRKSSDFNKERARKRSATQSSKEKARQRYLTLSNKEKCRKRKSMGIDRNKKPIDCISAFQKAIQNGPIYICKICNRSLL